MSERPAVRADGIRLPRRARGLTLDVEIEGRRVFSSAPSHADRVDDIRLVEWPDSLRPFLRGAGHIRVVSRDGVTIVDEEYVFDSSTQRPRVEDASGRPLAVDKNGRMQHTFDSGGPAEAAVVLDHAEMVLDVLDAAGVPAFLTAGALLGAVRDGHLIAHDCDVDLGYVSTAATPAGVALESYRLQRLFTQRLIETRRFSAAEFKLLLPGPVGTTGIDIRAAFEIDGTVYVAPNIELPHGMGRLVPLSEVQLEGRRLPAPADPAGLLAAMYGPEWRVPDPSFAFATPERVTRRLDGWVRGAAEDRSAWQRWHHSRMGASPRGPSDFARWVGRLEPALAPGVDLGCGAGGDAVWLARSGRWVMGLDYSPYALARARAAATKAESTTAHFDECAFGDLREVLTRGARFARARTPRSLYARRLVDGLNPAARDNLWVLASMTLRRGGRLYLELGTATNEDMPPLVRRRARRLALTPEMAVAEITAHGGQIQHQELVEGQARSDGKPPGTRLVATWQR